MFEPGHEKIGGRKKGSLNKRTQLMRALEDFEQKNKGDFNEQGVDTMLELYFKRALVDGATLRDLMAKIYPDLKAIEADVLTKSPVQLLINVGGKPLVVDSDGARELPESESPAIELSEHRKALPSPSAGAPRV